MPWALTAAMVRSVAMRRAPLLAVLCCLAAGPTVHVTVDFGQPADYPLSKSKFAVFNSGMVRPDRYARDMPLYDEVRPDSLRVDLGWGAKWIGWHPEPIGGTADHLTYDFGEMDRVATLLRDHGTLAYWSYCYTPSPLQPKRGQYTGMPTDLPAWASVLRTVAAHYRAFPGGNPVGYHEVGNEPDNRDFFTGDLARYQQLYQLGSQAIRDGDPDAVVGGPALAFSSDWVDPFLDKVVADHSPLDFYSFHWYPGVPYASPKLDDVLRQMRDALAKRPALRTVEAHLNEFNSYRIDYPKGGRQDKYPLAAAFLHDVKRFLDQPWLTKVSWAQFQDSGGGNFSGMISIDGHRKAVFNAYASYMKMPADRVQFESDDIAIEGMASFAERPNRQAAVLIWNRSSDARHVRLTRTGSTDAPLWREVLPIDRAHSSSGDGGDDTQERLDVAVDSTGGWELDVPPHGVVCLDTGRQESVGSRLSDPAPPAGRIVRELHDYPDRSRRSYADFDRRTWTARLGMAGEDRATARVGATVDNLAEATLTVTTTGTVGPAGTVGARVDYQSKGGAYTRAVLFRTTDGGTADAPVWGTARPADVVERIDGRTPLNLRRHAPADWTGRVQVSFVLADAGPDARATFRLTQ